MPLACHEDIIHVEAYVFPLAKPELDAGNCIASGVFTRCPSPGEGQKSQGAEVRQGTRELPVSGADRAPLTAVPEGRCSQG